MSGKIDNTIKAMGQADLDNDEIILNLRKGDVIATILHEKIHLQRPELSEAEVEAAALDAQAKMTLPEMADLINDFYLASKNPPHKIQITHTKVIK